MADRIVVINNGLIEQVGTPEQIYREPATRFVAEFIGAMNFLPASAGDGGEIRIGKTPVRVQGVDLPEGASALLAAIRPEDIRVGEGVENCVDARVESVEFLGPFVRAELSSEMDAGPLYADFSANLVREQSLARGSELRITLPADSIRLYPA